MEQSYLGISFDPVAPVGKLWLVVYDRDSFFQSTFFIGAIIWYVAYDRDSSD
jgi:hypothetical protein